MRVALLSPAAERRERLRRERATALALWDVYPTLQHLRLEFLFRGPGPNPPAMQSHTLHGAARAFFEFQCPYADCDGKFDLASAVKAALADASHVARGELECSGERPARVGARQLCRLHLDYTVTATSLPDAT